jgi:hypothetical protein
MKCIDAIEGTAKFIIDHLHKTYVEDRLDDTDYIRNIKAVLEATEAFIKHNKELFSEPKMLWQVLYDYAKKIWLANLYQRGVVSRDDSNSNGYYHYYFDHIFNQGTYPR